MSQVAALTGGRTNAEPPWGLRRTGSSYHACQGRARLFHPERQVWKKTVERSKAKAPAGAGCTEGACCLGKGRL